MFHTSAVKTLHFRMKQVATTGSKEWNPNAFAHPAGNKIPSNL